MLLLLSTLLAEAASSASPLGPLFDYLLNFGVLAVFMILVLTGRLVPRGTLDQVIKEKEAAQKVAADSLALWEQVLPTLTEVNREMIPALRSAAEQLKAAGVANGATLARVDEFIRKVDLLIGRSGS